MKKLFAIPDPEYDRQMIKKDFVDRFLCGDEIYLDDDEIAVKETMFDKLSELAKVVEDVKKKLRKRK